MQERKKLFDFSPNLWGEKVLVALALDDCVGHDQEGKVRDR